MNRMLILVAVAILSFGCEQQRINPVTASVKLTGNGDTVDLNEQTKPMIGQWGFNGKAGLVVTEIDGRMKFSRPKNDTWRMVISDAKICGNEVMFTQRNYLLVDGSDHPDNGVACNFVAKMIDGDKLELGMTTEVSPGYAANTFSRIK